MLATASRRVLQLLHTQRRAAFVELSQQRGVGARFLRGLARTGALYVQWESLLSTRKNELGMLEDLLYVLQQPEGLRGVRLRFVLSLIHI